MTISVQADLEERLKDGAFAKEYGENIAKAEIAVTVSQARRSKNMTQEDLAKTLDYSQSYIAKLESGDANPTIGKIGRILACLGLRVSASFSPLSSRIEEKSIRFESIDSSEVDSSWTTTVGEVWIATQANGMFLTISTNEETQRWVSSGNTVFVGSSAAGSLVGSNIDSDIIWQAQVGGGKEESTVSGGKK